MIDDILSAPTTTTFSIFAGLDELAGDGQRIDEARAGRLHVERSDVADADHVADQVGGRRKHEVRRRGGADHEIDLARCRAGFLQQAAHGLSAHVGGAEPLAFQDAPLANAGALDDPGIGRLHHLGEFVVGQHVLRQMAVDAGDGGPDRWCTSFLGFVGHVGWVGR